MYDDADGRWYAIVYADSGKGIELERVALGIGATSEEADERAALAVRAVNSHAALVDALREIRDKAKLNRETVPWLGCDDRILHLFADIEHAARTALAAAEETK